MAPDGELTFGASFFQDTQRYNLGFQALPWLETTFRYSGLQRFDPNYPVYFDRAFGVKARLWDEGEIIPAVAVGASDIVGSGIYSGEYLVASKRFGALDASIGIGWGRFSNTATFRNPLTLVSNSFETRSTELVAGAANFGTLFHGPKVGLFGGVVWQTPFTGLSLLAEYSSDMYSREKLQGQYTPLRQVSVGLSYATDYLTMGLSWIYGNRVSASLIMRFDPVTKVYPESITPPPPPVHVRTEAQQLQALQKLSPKWNAFTTRPQNVASFLDALWKEGRISDVAVNGTTLVVTTATNAEQLCDQIAVLAQLNVDGIENISVRGRGQMHACRAQNFPIVALTVSMSPQPSAVPSMPVLIDASAQPAIPQTGIAVIRREAATQGITLEAIRISGSELIVYYINGRYFRETDILDRLTRVLMRHAPAEVERFRLISMVNSIPVREFPVMRMPTERRYQQDEIELLGRTADGISAPISNPVLQEVDRSTFPRLTWSISPQLRQALFDPNQPLGLQLLLNAQGSVEIVRGFSFNAGLETSLFDDYDTSRPSDSLLPHVRTEFVNYFSRGKTGIANLDFQYRFRLTPEIFAVAKGGYLESMFAGFGGEILWRPEGLRWAIGVDAYAVQQRGFERLFALQNYRAFTGHVSFYYQSPWYNLNLAIRAGQYLAGDRGFTFELTRRFSTGVEIGAFFTRTNVSATDFGEGSFDKGIIIRIPLNWALPFDTHSVFGMDLRPVQRDGGQRLMGDATLFEETRRSSAGEMFHRN
jgi:hypothetical protein